VSGWSHSPAAVVLAMGIFLTAHTAGEVLYSAGTMELLFRLAPEERQGQYGAFYGISNGLLSAAAPAVLGAAIALGAGWGWWVLAAATVLLALFIRAVSADAGARSRRCPRRPSAGDGVAEFPFGPRERCRNALRPATSGGGHLSLVGAAGPPPRRRARAHRGRPPRLLRRPAPRRAPRPRGCPRSITRRRRR